MLTLLMGPILPCQKLDPGDLMVLQKKSFLALPSTTMGKKP